MNKRLIPLALLVLLTWSTAGQALPTDRDKPIHISADKAVRDEKNGVTIYSGNVKMRQGSLELDSDKLTIYHESEDADKIVAHGTPAKMRQRPEVDEGLVHAHANIITYYRNRELVHLRTEARIEKEDGTLVTGDEIDYFIDKEVMKAQSDITDEANQIFVVIPPNPPKDAEASPGNVEVPATLDPNAPNDSIPATSSAQPSRTLPGSDASAASADTAKGT